MVSGFIYTRRIYLERKISTFENTVDVGVVFLLEHTGHLSETSVHYFVLCMMTVIREPTGCHAMMTLLP